MLLPLVLPSSAKQVILGTTPMQYKKMYSALVYFLEMKIAVMAAAFITILKTRIIFH
jgi:hypothetical protein